MNIGFATKGLPQLSLASQKNLSRLAHALERLGHSCFFWGEDDLWFQQQDIFYPDFQFRFHLTSEPCDIIVYTSFSLNNVQKDHNCAQVLYLNQTVDRLMQITEASEFLNPTLRLKKALSDYTSIISPSKYLRSDLHKAQLTDIAEVFVLRPGQTPHFSPGLDPDLDEHIHAITADRPYILCSNQADPFNNLESYLDALQLTHQYTPGLRGVVIASNTCEQSLLDKLLNRPKTHFQHLIHNTRDYVCWVSPEDLPFKLKRELFRRASLYCNPGKKLILSPDIGEAIACHCPLALAHSGVLPELAGQCANWFHPEDPVDLARIFATMSELNYPQQTYLPDDWNHVAQNCIKHFEELIQRQNEYV